MHILITGSKGLIGSELKKTLQSMGLDVIGIDKRYPIDHTEHGDILNHSHLTSLTESIQGIIHLGAISRVIDGEKYPELCWKTNVEGTGNIIEMAKASLLKPWIIYASSREVYGQQKSLPVKESDTLSPVNLYGESKCKGEELILNASKNGLVTAILRFSNVFGSVQDHPDRVIPAFCRAAATGTSIRIDGRENVFDFTCLEDVVYGIISMIHLILKTKQSIPPVHLTSGIGKSLEEVAAIACKASSHFITVVDAPSRSFDVSKFYGDTSRAKELLRWKASMPVEEGMKRLISKYEFLLDATPNDRCLKTCASSS
jgi:nucleoside-diphosphate-sugar epimerase